MIIIENGVERPATAAEEQEFLATQSATQITERAPPLDRLRFWLTAAEMGVTKSSVIAHATTAYSADPVALAKALAFIEEAQVYRLEDPILVAMAAAEGITEPQLSALWAWAQTTA